jgi:hypothetical protein
VHEKNRKKIQRITISHYAILTTTSQRQRTQKKKNKKKPKQNKTKTENTQPRAGDDKRRQKLAQNARTSEEENTTAVARLQAERTGSACGQQRGSRVRDCDRTGR